MKLKLLFLFPALLITTLGYTQKRGDVETGLNLGLNFSNISSNNYYDNIPTNTRISFNLGGSMEYYFSDNWGIKGKLIYDRKGWADDIFYFEDTEEEFITDYALNYITIPIMANFHFGRGRNWYVNFGPYLGFLTSAKAVDPNFDISEVINEEDYGFAFGGGYKFLVNEQIKFFFEFEVQSGLGDIFEDGYGDTITNGRTSINTGVLFLLY